MSQTNDEMQPMSPNLSRHGWSNPSLHQTHRANSRGQAKMKKCFSEQNINTYKSYNNSGVHKCCCFCKNSLQKRGEEEDDGAGLLFHLQNGASWPAVLGAADAAELCRRVLEGSLEDTYFNKKAPSPLLFRNTSREQRW